MMRRFLGALAASAAAPYLVISMMFVGEAVLKENASLYMFPAMVALGSLALVLWGIPILAISLVAASLFEALGWRSRPTCALAGAMVGSGFMALFFDDLHSFEGWLNVLYGTLAGGICGWIYWRIATGGRSEASVV